MMIWASVEGTVMSSEKRSLDHNTDLNISSELEEVLPEVDDLSLINPQQITVPYFEKSYNPTSPVYSPGMWGISTPDGPPPQRYSPVSPDGPPPQRYSPVSPDGPPPQRYSPVSPDGPPPGVYTPPTPPLPQSNMSGQEVTKILEDINEKLDELKEGKPEEEEEDEDILKIKEPKEEESSKGGGGETKKIRITN